MIRVVIADDGVGIAADADGGGLGLAGMRERAALLGGSLEVDAADGTVVRAVLPL